jgi:hypothetical protein
VACRRDFFLPVRVLSRLFRRLFLERLLAIHPSLKFYDDHAALGDPQAIAAYLAPLRRANWVVYRRATGRAGLSVALYPSRRHRQ